MGMRVKIVTPIQVDENDLTRRQRRYRERATPGTHIELVALSRGPVALESQADLDASEAAVYEAVMGLDVGECDAVLIDCIFDPAVRRLEAELPIPVFGPLRTVVAQLPLIAPNFGLVARARGHDAVFEALIEGYGGSSRLAGIRTLDLPYEQAKQPALFEAAMRRQLAAVVEEDGARSVLMGSTTMALEPHVAAAANGVPLLLSGMMTLGIMESLWQDHLLSPQA
jgi:Asp/Glu/hydantoin racemase